MTYPSGDYPFGGSPTAAFWCVMAGGPRSNHADAVNRPTQG
jgi:hypothetical protein